MPKLKIPLRYIIILLLLVLFIPKSSRAYAVLTHEALVDASWKKSILPLLKYKYPGAADSDLVKAHAYAYGGCLIADMGYYPFGNVYFTDLAHYVRSGDFVENLLSEAQNLDEYAFALGALCHYMGDKYGHSLATNHVVPIVYPEMKERFGPVVTYDDDHISHSRVEIAFDVLETARGNYASQNYHDFIGFEVAKPVLERAFLKTYGEDINSVFSNIDLTISTFRWAVKSLLPTVTRTAWLIKKSDIKKLNPSANERTFHYRMKRKAYYKEFGSSRQKPKFKERVLAFIISIMPKIGPFKALKFKPIGPAGEKLFIASFDTATVHYDNELTKLHDDKINLKDVDYDTGKPTEPGEYGLADETYIELLDRLQKNKFIELTKPLQQNVLNYYNKADTVQLALKYSKDWKKTSLALQELKAATPIPIDSLKNAKGIYYRLNEPAVQPVNVNDGKIKSKPIPADEQKKVN